MSWKKSPFSNLMWVTYTLVTAVSVVQFSGAMVQMIGGPSYWGPLLALILGVMMAVCVFLSRKLPAMETAKTQKDANRLILGETIFAALFLLIGLVMRIGGSVGITDGGAYYHAALVEEGHTIPRVVHGASYLYLQLLHTLFTFVGNKLGAALGFQIFLQLLATAGLYYGVRKMMGIVPAMVMLGFFMCMPSVVDSALTVSPESMYMVLFAVGFVILSLCRGNLHKKVLFLIAGLWIGLIGYLDIGGMLLVLVVIALVLDGWEPDAPVKPRLVAFMLSLTGALAIFFGLILVDSFMSGKPFPNVLQAWWALYAPGNFGVSIEVLNGSLSWEGPLFLLMCFGIFSYWLSQERENLSIWMLIVCVAIIAQYCGMLQNGVSATLYILMFMTALAGIGIRTTLRVNEKLVGEVEANAAKMPAAQEIEEFEEEDPDMFPMKLPKYLYDPDSDLATVPKYMENEGNISRPQPLTVPQNSAPESDESQMSAAEPVKEEIQESLSESGTTKETAYAQQFLEEDEFETEEPVATERPPQEQEMLEDELFDVEIFDSGHPVPEEPKATAVNESVEYTQAMYGVPEKFQSRVQNEPPKPAQVRQLPELEIEDLEPEKTAGSVQDAVTAQAAVLAEAAVQVLDLNAPEAEQDEKPEDTVSAKPRYIENPLPLPKPHQKREMDYNIDGKGEEDDFDYPVSDDDDFDI